MSSRTVSTLAAGVSREAAAESSDSVTSLREQDATVARLCTVDAPQTVSTIYIATSTPSSEKNIPGLSYNLRSDPNGFFFK